MRTYRVTFNLTANLQVMMRTYAKSIPNADRGRNLATLNRHLDATPAPNPHFDRTWGA
jgi:hypothetical protein